jgi:hypothetical protein
MPRSEQPLPGVKLNPKTGRWEVRLKDWFGASIRVGVYDTAARGNAAKAKEQELIGKYKGEYVRPAVRKKNDKTQAAQIPKTLGEYVERWRAKINADLELTTLSTYDHTINHYLRREVPLPTGEKVVLADLAFNLDTITPTLISLWIKGVKCLSREDELSRALAQAQVKSARITPSSAARLWLKSQAYPVPDSGTLGGS